MTMKMHAMPAIFIASIPIFAAGRSAVPQPEESYGDRPPRIFIANSATMKDEAR